MTERTTTTIGAVQDNATLGIVLMLLAMATLNGMDAISKLLTEQHSGVQVAWARYTFHLLPLVLFAGPSRVRRMLVSGNLHGQLLRSTSFTISAIFIVFAFARMQFAEAIAITFVSPLLIVVLSWQFLGEKVGIHRWIAVLVGFAGMLLMVWPSAGLIDLGAFYAIAATLFWAIGLTMTRHVRNDDPWSTLLYTALVGTVLTSLAVPFFWTSPTLSSWMLMLIMGVTGGLAHALLINAFRFANASLLAPFNYSMLIWATLFGWLLFAQLPGPRVVIGAVIITAAGLYAWHREQVRAKA